jgi:hypothetical protein
MTDLQWKACADPQPMLALVRGKASPRKMRLFACGCCRHLWECLTDERSRKALQTVESFADGQATPKELLLAAATAWRTVGELAHFTMGVYAWGDALDAGVNTSNEAWRTVGEAWACVVDHAYLACAVYEREWIRPSEHPADRIRSNTEFARAALRRVASIERDGAEIARDAAEAALVVAEQEPEPRREFARSLAARAKTWAEEARRWRPPCGGRAATLAAWAVAEAAGIDENFAALAAEAARASFQALATTEVPPITAQAAQERQANLLRDVLGPSPSGPTSIPRHWYTPTVMSLAAAIYQSRDYTILPMLGDALQEAGCSDASVLAHCQESRQHAPGCWLIDALLGRT